MSTTAAPPTRFTHAGVVTLDAHSLRLTDDQFFQLCADNRDLRFEMTADGEMIIMTPTGTETGRKNSELNFQLRGWAKQDGTGEAFDSSTGFILPNGAKRSPDAAWILKSRYEALLVEQREKLAPICPDFVIELRSRTDSLDDLHEKMREYIAQGARLGWLLDPPSRTVYVYRPDTPVERLNQPEHVSGEPVLRGFVLDLREIW